MEASYSYIPGTDINKVSIHQIQQYQIYKQQEKSLLAPELINHHIGIKQLNQSCVHQEFSLLVQNGAFKVENQQQIVSREQQGRLVLQKLKLKLMNNELNTKIDELRRTSKKSSQSQEDEQGKKQQDVEDFKKNKPRKIKLIRSNQRSSKLTVKIKKETSDLSDDSIIKSLEEYKMKIKDQQQKSLQYHEKLQRTEKKIRQYRQMYDQSQTNVKRLSKKNQNLEEQVEIITAENGRKDNILLSQKQDIEHLYLKIAYIQEQNKYQFDNLRQKIHFQKEKVQSLEKQIKLKNIQKQQISQNLKTIVSEYQHQIALKDQLNQQKTIQHLRITKKFQDKISQKQKQIILIEQVSNKLQTEKKSFQGKIKNFEAAVVKLQQQSKNLKQQKDSLKTKIVTQNIQKQALNTKFLVLEQQFKKQKETNQKLSKQRDIERCKNQRQINDLRNKLKNAQQILTEKQKQYSINILQKEELVTKMVISNQRLTEKNLKYISILKPLQDITNVSFDQDNLSQDTNNLLIGKILRGSYFNQSYILNTVDCQKTYFLYKQLRTFLSTPTIKTQMVFKFDPINPHNNFFRYISGVKNLMVLVKLKNGTMVGGFTVFAFASEVQRPGKGFIFSLSAQKSFKIKKEPKVAVITNDTYFLIIGNSQIRLKYNQTKFFTNFGVAASTFENNGFTKQEFLGIKQPNISQVEFQTYEIFAIHAEK